MYLVSFLTLGVGGREKGGGGGRGMMADEIQCFKTDGQLVVGYSLTPAFG